MGLVLDKNSIILYDKWLQSPAGKVMDEFVQSMITVLLSPYRHDKILDIGCGTGNQLLSLARYGFDLSGVDASQDMINIAKNRLGDRCEFKTGQAEDLPFSDNEFDIALLINTLEFLDDPAAALKEAGRVAKRKVLICVINSLSLYSLGARLQGFFCKTFIRHIRPRHLWEMKSHIKDAYGAVPVVWKCSPDWPRLKARHDNFDFNMKVLFNNPVGAILGMSVTLNPLIRAESLRLKIKADRPFPEGVPIQNQGGMLYERGISL